MLQHNVEQVSQFFNRNIPKIETCAITGVSKNIVPSFGEGRVQVSVGAFWGLFQMMF